MMKFCGIPWTAFRCMHASADFLRKYISVTVQTSHMALRNWFIHYAGKCWNQVKKHRLFPGFRYAVNVNTRRWIDGIHPWVNAISPNIRFVNGVNATKWKTSPIPTILQKGKSPFYAAIDMIRIVKYIAHPPMQIKADNSCHLFKSKKVYPIF